MSTLWRQFRTCWRKHISVRLYSARARQAPYPYYKELRDLAPIHCLKKKGYWAVSRYEDVQAVLSDPDLYRSSELPGLESSLLQADGPGHSRVRRLVARAFTPSNLDSLADYIRTVARGYVDMMAAQGQCEFMGDLARPLPAKVVATLLGLDPERLSDYHRWTAACIVDEPERLDAATQERYAVDQREREAFLRDHLMESRAGRGRGVLSAEVLPHLTDEEAIDVLRLLLVSGHTTTAHLLGNMAVALLQNPGVQDSLRADPKLIPSAMDEVLRINSPVVGVLRRPTRDVTLGGRRIPANAPMLLLLGSANHSEEQFADGDRFCPARKEQGHLSFGKGVHFCLGAGLGRLEAKIVLETLLERLEVFEAAEPLDEIKWDDSNTQLRGPQRLKLNVRAFA